MSLRVWHGTGFVACLRLPTWLFECGECGGSSDFVLSCFCSFGDVFIRFFFQCFFFRNFFRGVFSCRDFCFHDLGSMNLFRDFVFSCCCLFVFLGVIRFRACFFTIFFSNHFLFRHFFVSSCLTRCVNRVGRVTNFDVRWEERIGCSRVRLCVLG